MTLLQQIIHQLNVELDRLQSLRAIVAGLGAPAPRAGSADPTRVARLAPEPPSNASPVRPRRTSTRSKPARPQPQKPLEFRALSSSVPSGPVVVSAQELARERELRRSAKPVAPQAEEEPVTSEAALNALTRDLAIRWRSGTVGTA